MNDRLNQIIWVSGFYSFTIVVVMMMNMYQPYEWVPGVLIGLSIIHLIMIFSLSDKIEQAKSYESKQEEKEELKGEPYVDFLINKFGRKHYVYINNYSVTPEELEIFYDKGWELFKDDWPDMVFKRVKEKWTIQTEL